MEILNLSRIKTFPEVLQLDVNKESHILQTSGFGVKDAGVYYMQYTGRIYIYFFLPLPASQGTRSIQVVRAYMSLTLVRYFYFILFLSHWSWKKLGEMCLYTNY